MSAEAGRSPFSARAIIFIIVAGVLAFAGLVLLSAYAPDLASGRNGGAHALSTSAVGYKGIGDLIEGVGAKVERIRDEQRLDAVALLVLTPDLFSDPAKLASHVTAHGQSPALIVLPKWQTVRLPQNPAWVQGAGPMPPQFTATLLAKLVKASVQQVPGRGVLEPAPGIDAVPRFAAPALLQTIAGPELRPLLTDGAGNIVLAEIGDRQLFILADPDLLNNKGLADPRTARAALALLGALGPEGARSVAFDLALNGFAKKPNLLKLAFDPPFLALTLALVGAALLAGIQAAFRFGAPAREERAIGFGKAALVDNAAALLALAKREHRAGAGYALLTRDAVAAVTGAPQYAGGDAIDDYLDRLGGDVEGGSWHALAAAARTAPDRHALLAAARALHDWRRRVTREG